MPDDIMPACSRNCDWVMLFGYVNPTLAAVMNGVSPDLGADIGLVCLTCGHRVMLTRRETDHRIKTIVSRGEMKSNVVP